VPGDGPMLSSAASRSDFTYAELEKLSNQLAHALIETGSSRGDRIGIICTNRCGDRRHIWSDEKPARVMFSVIKCAWIRVLVLPGSVTFAR